MEKKQFEQLMLSLKKIEMKMDLLVKLIRSNMPSPKVTTKENKILKLCNQKHTIDDMVKKTGKTKNNVRVILTYLRNKGLIMSTKIKGELVYKRT